MSLESEFLSLLLKDTLSEDREKGARIRIDIKTSDGKEFHFEKPPMSQERFEGDYPKFCVNLLRGVE